MPVFKHNIVTLLYSTFSRAHRWILRRKEDRARVLDFTMFETAGKGNVMQGERFVFEKRQILDAAGAGLSEDALRTSGRSP
jgi:hypothetical protein